MNEIMTDLQPVAEELVAREITVSLIGGSVAAVLAIAFLVWAGHCWGKWRGDGDEDYLIGFLVCAVLTIICIGGVCSEVIDYHFPMAAVAKDLVPK